MNRNNICLDNHRWHIVHILSQDVFGFKYLASEKSNKPWSRNIAQALATCPDSSVAIYKKGLVNHE